MPRRRAPADQLLSRIDALRQRGMTWGQIAAAIDTHDTTLMAWASRRRQAPQRPSIAERLLEALPGLERADSGRGEEN